MHRLHASALGVELGLEPPAELDDERSIALGLLVGEFPAAIAAATDLERRHATSAAEFDHVGPTLVIITSLIEEGHEEQAVRVAGEFEKRTAAWSLNDARVRRAADRQEAFVAIQKPTAAFGGHVANADGSRVDLDVARPYLEAPQFSGQLEAIRGEGSLPGAALRARSLRGRRLFSTFFVTLSATVHQHLVSRSTVNHVRGRGGSGVGTERSLRGTP